MKFLLALLALLVTTPCMSQESASTYDSRGIKYYQDSRVIEIEYNPFAKQDSLVEFHILADKEYLAKLKDTTDQKGVYAVFYLPKGSDKTIVYIQKSYVKPKNIKSIIEFKEKLYIKYYEAKTRIGYDDVTIQYNSLGGWKYRRESNFGRAGEISMVGNMLVWTYPGDQHPVNSPATITKTWTERVSRDKELLLFLK